MSSKSNKSNQSHKNTTVRREINYEETNPQNQFSIQPQYYPQLMQYFPHPQQHPLQQYSQPQTFSQPQSFSQQQPFSPTQQFSQPQQFSPQQFSRIPTQESQEANNTEMVTEDNEDSDNNEEDIEVAPTQIAKKNRLTFSNDEDRFLARAFIRISENAARGNDNKIAMYWAAITTEYNSMAAECGFEERNTSSLKNRFTKMRAEMVMYKRAVNMVESVHHTGENEIGMLKRVDDKYMELNSKNKNRPFAFQHVVDILNQSSKFNYTTTRNRIPTVREEGTNSSSSNGSPQSPKGASRASTQQSNDPHSGDKRSRATFDDSVSSPTRRPMGNKAAKKLLQKGKGKAGSGSGSGKDEFAEKYFTHRQTEIEIKREAHNAKLKALENKMELEARRLSIKEEELRQKQEDRRWARELERDREIMNTDINKMATDEEKAELMAMRSAILRKWAK